MLRYNELVEKAIDNTKLGGNSGDAQVFATLALAAAIRDSGVTNEDIRDLSGSLMAIADAISESNS